MKKFLLTMRHAFTRVPFVAFAIMYPIIFYREYVGKVYCVWSGMSKFQERHKHKKNVFNIIRDLHRIEKGLTNSKPRKTFATGYITGLVKSLNQSIDLFDDEMKCYAKSVLDQYFTVCTPNYVITEALKIYQGIEFDTKQITGDKKVVKWEPIGKTATLEELILARRSVRNFTAEPISKEVLTELINIARNAPSACNRLGFHVHIIDDKLLIDKLANKLPGTNSWIEKIYTLLVYTADHSAYSKPRDQNAPTIDASLSGMQLIQLLHQRGYGSCVINYPENFKTDKYFRQKLNLDNFEKPIYLMAVGRPDIDAKSPFSEKRKVIK